MTHPEPQLAPAREVDFDDVDDIIGLAAEMRHADEGKLTIEELTEVAAELDLPAQYVDRAVAALEHRRAAALAASARRRRALSGAAIATVAVLAVVVLSGLASVNALRARASEVEMRRAQVGNVIGRRDRVVARVDADEREAQAELAGADNRVAIETHRYDESASAYNAEASRFPENLWGALFGVPSHYPLSSEIERW